MNVANFQNTKSGNIADRLAAYAEAISYCLKNNTSWSFQTLLHAGTFMIIDKF